MSDHIDSVDVDKLNAAFERLKTNPDASDVLAAGIDEFFLKLQIELNQEEKTAFLRTLFAFNPEADTDKETEDYNIRYSNCPYHPPAPPVYRFYCTQSTNCCH